jgi:hypothetical protein
MLILSKIYAVNTRHPLIVEPANLQNFIEVGHLLNPGGMSVKRLDDWFI